MIDRPRLRWVSRWDAAAPYLFLAPFALVFAVFTVLPSVATFVLAWWQWDPLGARAWVGAANFERLAADPRFWTATTNTLAIAAAATIVQVGIALGLAHLIHRVAGRAVGAVRVSLLVPFVTSGAAITILVAQLLDRDYGSVNRLLDALGEVTLVERELQLAVLEHVVGARLVIPSAGRLLIHELKPVLPAQARREQVHDLADHRRGVPDRAGR